MRTRGWAATVVRLPLRSSSTPGGSPRSTGTCRRRRRHRRASRPGDPRPGQRALARLPPGAAVANAARRAARFWTWRELMYDAAGRLTRTRYQALARRDLRRDGAGRNHRGRRVPLPAPRCRRAALRRPERDGQGADRRRGRRRRPADAAGHLLPDARDSTARRWPTVRNDDSATARATAWAERVDGLRTDVESHEQVIVGAAIHSVRAVPPAEMTAVVEWADSPRAPLHVHSSEQTAEVDAVPGRARLHPDRAAARQRTSLGSRTTAVHATHLTGQDIADMDRTATGVCFCPTTERDLGDGIGPAPALLAAPGPFSLGSRQPRDDRPVRGGPRPSSWTSGWPAASADHLRRRRCWTPQRVAGQRALGWTDAGGSRVGRTADLVAVDTRTRSVPPGRRHGGERRVRRDRPPTSPTWSSTVDTWSTDGRHVALADVGGRSCTRRSGGRR